MTYYKGNQNHLLIAVFTSSLLASMLIVNSSIAGQGLRASDTTTKTTNNTQFGSMMNNMTMSSTVKKVRVGDIDIAYKMFGKGKRLLLIAGSGATMDMWDPAVLRQLSANHTVIIFDSRGKGQTSAGTIKNMTMSQFANDTAGLIDALGIRKPVDVLGLSWGGYVAQELTLMHPQKVNKLILYGTDCGGKATILSPQISPEVGRSIESGNASIDTFLSILFPKEWIKQNAAYVQKVFSAATPVPQENIQHQAQTTYNWKGTCDRLSSITKPTLVVTGADDIVRPPANSIMLVEKIPGAWLVQIRGGGHYVMFQYPEQFTAVLETFLSVT